MSLCDNSYPPEHTVILFFPSADSIVLLFLLSKVAQKKKKQKENAERESDKGNFLKKVSFGILQKLLSNRRRNVGRAHPK